MWPGFPLVTIYSVVPNLFGTRGWFHGRQFFHRLRGGKWFWDDSSILHLWYTLFCYYCIIYVEIIIQFIIMQNQWEPWACFLAVIWSYLGWWETVTPEVCCYAQSTLLSHCHRCRKPCFTKTGCWKWKQAVSAFVAISEYTSRMYIVTLLI